jgi:cell division protein FtsL
MANKKHTNKKNIKKTTNGITTGMVLVILIAMAIVLTLATVKTSMANKIYYQSKKVNKIKREVSALKAERIMLKQSVETLRFKYNVSDTIFSLDENK